MASYSQVSWTPQGPRLNPLVLPRSRLMSAATSCVEMFALTEGTSRGELGIRSGTSE